MDLKPAQGRIIFFQALVLSVLVFGAAGLNQAGANNVGQSIDLTELSISRLMEIEIETVYGASKYEQNISDAPSSVSIIKAEDIKAFGYRNLTDILQSIRGLYSTYDRNYHYLGIRGFAGYGDYNTRFLLLIDGHRLNDNVYGMAALGMDFILDIDLIERVEVIRGPSSSLYGASAFLGVINVITRNGSHIDGLEASAEAASLKTYKGRLSYGKRYENGTDVILSATGYDSHGKEHLYFREFDDPSTNDGMAVNLDGDRFKSMFSSFSYGCFTIQGGYVSREKVIPTAPWGYDFNNALMKTIDDRGYLDMSYRHHFNDDVKILARLFYDYYLYKGIYPVASVENIDEGEGQWWGSEIQVDARIGTSHRVTVGGEFTHSFKNIQTNYDVRPYALWLDEKHKAKHWALYVQDEFKVSDNLLINAGIRHDHYETFGGTTNPRVAVIFQPVKSMAFKILYGQAFRAPNAYELYYNDGGISQKSNAQLKPETIKTYELILERYFPNHLRTSVSLFANRFKDLISLKTDPRDDLLVFTNVDEVKTTGVEFEVEKKWQNGFSGLFSYAYQESKNKQSDKKLGNSPRHLVKLHLLVPIIRSRLTAGLEQHYISRRLLISENETGDAFITNLTLYGKTLLKNLDVSLSAYNLFDMTYEHPGSQEHAQDMLEQDGRGLRLKLTYRF